MALYQENHQQSLMLIILLLITSITSCSGLSTVHPAAKTDVLPREPVQLKIFNTSREYFDEGKVSFGSKRFQEARNYLYEAVRLDQNNQAAHLLLGVVYMKLGQGTQARREFEMAVQINAQTADGETARSWLKRLDNPVTVGILPPKLNWSVKIIQDWAFSVAAAVLSEDDSLEKAAQSAHNIVNRDLNGTKNWYYLIMKNTLSECGFYSIIEIAKTEPMQIEENTVRENVAGKPAITAITRANSNLGQQSTISYIKDNNIDILIECNIEEDIIMERSVFKGDATITIRCNIDLYSANDSKLVKHISHMIPIGKIPIQKRNDIDTITNQAFDKLFREVALKIHDALL